MPRIHHGSWIFYLRWYALYSFIVYIIFVIWRLYAVQHNTTPTQTQTSVFWFLLQWRCHNGVLYTSDEQLFDYLTSISTEPYKCTKGNSMNVYHVQHIVLHVISCNNTNHCQPFWYVNPEMLDLCDRWRDNGWHHWPSAMCIISNEFHSFLHISNRCLTFIVYFCLIFITKTNRNFISANK